MAKALRRPSLGSLGVACRRGARATCLSSYSFSGDGVVDELKRRGLMEACTGEEGLRELLREGPQKVYCGFDPTAKSLHLGHLPAILALEWFRRHGHEAWALLGGATGRVGDPSGKSTERPLLAEEELEANVEGVRATIEQVLGRGVRVVNNLEWFGDMGFLEFLRDVGKHARLGPMLAKDSVRIRMEGEGEGMSFTEFTYQLLQAYDFVHLHYTHGVRVQVGGSDQWGNITAGTELTRKMNKDDRVFGVTLPLLLKSDGSKFGKTEGGAIWLDPALLSPYRFYQALFQTTDDDVCHFLRALTFLPESTICPLERDIHNGAHEPNRAQRLLAETVTEIVHGQEGLNKAHKATEALRPGSDAELDAATLDAIAGEAPTSQLSRSEVEGVPVIDVLVKSGLQSSKSAARRMVYQGAVRINNGRLQDPEQQVARGDILDDRVLLLAVGKKNKCLIRVS